MFQFNPGIIPFIGEGEWIKFVIASHTAGGFVGVIVGITVGFDVGFFVGALLGLAVWDVEGIDIGKLLWEFGLKEGILVGRLVGAAATPLYIVNYYSKY